MNNVVGDKKKMNGKKIILYSCLVLIICTLVTFTSGIVGFLIFPEKGNAKRREGYMTSYNYEGLEEPPWLYTQEDLAEFDEQTEILKLVEGEIPASFYEEIMESDVDLDILEEEKGEIREESFENYFVNSQLGYKFDAGEYKTSMYELVGEAGSDFDDNTAIYCIKTSEEYYTDFYCDAGYASVFAIYRYTVSEYNEIVEFYDDGGGIPFDILDYNSEYYWILQRAEYETIPDDAYLYESFYRTLRGSFTIF